MKTETQTAKENVEEKLRLERLKQEETSDCWLHSQMRITLFEVNKTIETHRATCQRFLGFLKLCKKYYKDIGKEKDNFVIYMLKPKITDLQNAIKIYENAGIR